MEVRSENFVYLEQYDDQLVRLAYLADCYFSDDPNTCLLKLRQFNEHLAQLTAAYTARYTTTREHLVDVLRRLTLDRVIPRDVADLFH